MDRADRKTRSTVTAEGEIPHVRMIQGFFAPVKLDFDKPGKDAMGAKLRFPKRQGARLVYALPGGGEFVP